MKSTITFTTNMSGSLMQWLESYISKKKTTKRAVIEEALKALQKEEKRKELAESFKRAANDPEIMQMAEEDLADYLEQLHELEV